MSKTITKIQKAAIFYVVPAVLSVLVFAIFYGAVFNIGAQTPDNHLAVFNFFGICYKDLFISAVCSSFIGCAALITESITLFKTEKRVLLIQAVLSLLIIIVSGWLISYIGSYFISNNVFSQSLLCLVVSIIYITPFYCIYTKTMLK